MKQATEAALVELTNFSVRVNSIAHRPVGISVLSVQDNPNLEGATPSLREEASAYRVFKCYRKVKCPIFFQLPGRNPDVMVCSMPHDSIALSTQWRRYMQTLFLLMLYS